MMALSGCGGGSGSNLAASNEEALLTAAPSAAGNPPSSDGLVALAVRFGTYDQSGVMAAVLAGANPLVLASPVVSALAGGTAANDEQLIHNVSPIGTNVDTLA